MMDDKEKSEKKHSFEEADKASGRGRKTLNLTVQVSEMEVLSSQTVVNGGANSTQTETSESICLSVPVQSMDEPASSSREASPSKYLPIPVSLPPTDECQLCGRKFQGNFRQYPTVFCVDCSRFKDCEYDTKKYKRPSGPRMTTY